MDNRIFVIYGDNPSSMTKTLLNEENIGALISSKDSKIVLKPNLVIAGNPEDGSVTHNEILISTIEYLKDHGFNNITIAEGSWVGSRTEEAFRKLNYYSIAKKYDVALVDTKKDKFRTVESHGIRMEIAECALNADFIINMPVLKGHCQTLMTHAMKNLKGFLSDKSKRDFHRFGLMRPIAALSDIIKVGLVISDSICGDLDFEEGGNPVETNRMMASTNPILLDSYGASLMGFSPSDIGYLEVAKEWKIGDIDISKAEIIELNRPEAKVLMPKGTARALSKYTEPKDACSACYASLIHALKRLDEENGLGVLKGRRVAIGQGYRGDVVDLGVGICCSKAKNGVLGCPAKADEILNLLRNL